MLTPEVIFLISTLAVAGPAGFAMSLPANDTVTFLLPVESNERVKVAVLPFTVAVPSPVPSPLMSTVSPSPMPVVVTVKVTFWSTSAVVGSAASATEVASFWTWMYGPPLKAEG